VRGQSARDTGERVGLSAHCCGRGLVFGAVQEIAARAVWTFASFDEVIAWLGFVLFGLGFGAELGLAVGEATAGVVRASAEFLEFDA